MEWGIHLPHVGRQGGRDALLRMARLADESGMHSGWVSDHIAWPTDISSQYPYTDDGHFPATNDMPKRRKSRANPAHATTTEDLVNRVFRRRLTRERRTVSAPLLLTRERRTVSAPLLHRIRRLNFPCSHQRRHRRQGLQWP
jgi:alkanesulfonate monooxygenase SsuD/methylene tetrahydromethanopterin reductase-like flavin-dependent oxidoreductase (luciferase family)